MPEQRSIDDRKRDLRKQLLKRRSEQPEKDIHSQRLFGHLQDVEEYIIAQTVLFYVDVRDEVRTLAVLRAELAKSTRVVVPYCIKGRLKLAELQNTDELSVGAYGILEPNETLKQQPSRSVKPSQIDVALIPGLGFDRQGGRIGHGKGYYDRLIPELTKNCCRIGIAYDCQIVDHIPISVHDQFMNLVVTETQVISCELS